MKVVSDTDGINMLMMSSYGKWSVKRIYACLKKTLTGATSPRITFAPVMTA
jgi:hypothetical protein